MKNWFYGLAVLAVWETVGRSGMLPAYRLPGPTLIVNSYTVQMGYGVLATALRTVVGFLAGAVLAYTIVLISYLTGTLKAMDAQFAGARAIPFLAAAPLFIMWFGIGELSRLLVVFLSVAAFVAGPLTESVRGLPREWTVQRQRYGKDRRWEFLNIVIPGTLGPMVGPLRVALAVALTVAIAGDFMGSTVGIGRAIDSARVTFNTPAIFLLIAMSALLGIGLDAALSRGLRKVGHWIGRTAKA